MKRETPTRIAVAEDHPVVRKGVAAAVASEDDMQLVGACPTAAEAIAIVLHEKPDILLLDMNLPDESGLAVIKALRSAESGTKVIVLTGFDSLNYRRRCLEMGVSAYVTKDAPLSELIEIIRRVRRGEVLSFGRFPRGTSCFELLTEREFAILELLAGGLSNSEIADELSLSEHTIRNHLSSLYTKINVHSSRQAIALAVEKGIIGL